MDSKAYHYSWAVESATGETIELQVPQVIKTFEDFALADIATGDIDPTYWAIHRAYKEWGRPWAARFCVGMLTYYHTGTAAKAADYEGDDFWNYLSSIYESAPRAAERRHFRGDAGKIALRSMKQFSPDPSKFFEEFPHHYNGIRTCCESRLAQFGSYFQLKVCDYMDRCLGYEVYNFLGLGENLPSLPAKAVKMIYPSYNVGIGFSHLLHRMEAMKLKAPPLFDRPLDGPEVETILCDWKRAKSGSSWIGADVADKRQSFRGFGGKAAAMADMMPPPVVANMFKVEL